MNINVRITLEHEVYIGESTEKVGIVEIARRITNEVAKMERTAKENHLPFDIAKVKFENLGDPYWVRIIYQDNK